MIDIHQNMGKVDIAFICTYVVNIRVGVCVIYGFRLGSKGMSWKELLRNI